MPIYIYVYIYIYLYIIHMYIICIYIHTYPCFCLTSSSNTAFLLKSKEVVSSENGMSCFASSARSQALALADTCCLPRSSIAFRNEMSMPLQAECRQLGCFKKETPGSKNVWEEHQQSKNTSQLRVKMNWTPG